MKFSIVIPVYNVAEYLHECLDSMEGQTYTDWEAICVDDGSTDGSGAILDEYAARDSRFHIIHQPNAGVSVARNRALDAARGEWIGFVDADDIIVPGWLAEVKRLVDGTGVNFVRMSLARFKDGDAVPIVDLDNSYRVISGRECVDKWGYETLTRHGYACLSFQKNTLARSVPFPIGVKNAEDALRNLTLVRKCDAVCQSEYAGYFYRGYKTSSSLKKYSADERTTFFRFCENIIPGKDQVAKFASFAWTNLVYWAIWHENEGKQDREALHQQFSRLMMMSKIEASNLVVTWRVPYVMYMRLNIIWPISLVSFFLRVKSRCVRIIRVVCIFPR